MVKAQKNYEKIIARIRENLLAGGTWAPHVEQRYKKSGKKIPQTSIQYWNHGMIYNNRNHFTCTEFSTSIYCTTTISNLAQILNIVDENGKLATYHDIEMLMNITQMEYDS